MAKINKMPYGMIKRKYKGHGSYTVKNKATGHVFAKHTTKNKAKHQMNLLRGIEHGWRPTGKHAKK